MSGVASRLAEERAHAAGFGSNAKAVPFLNQRFEDLRAECQRSRNLFCDSTFPPTDHALGFKELGPGSYKTRGSRGSGPRLNLSSLKPSVLTLLPPAGDCWLLAAIASLTLNEFVMARVVPQDQSFGDNYAGIFHFQLWQYGEWVDVVVDDRLPVKDGELLFVHSAEKREFWTALLEKAYAKLNGSYEALSGGTTTEGFEDFTGGIAENFDLSKPPSNLFQILKKALEAGALLGCSIDITSAADSEAVTRQKLVKGHAYSLTGAVEVNYRGRMEKLVRVRNPWGQVEWTGAWSDGSSEWDHVQGNCPHANAEDGEFWMSYSEFCRHYNRIEVCTLTPDAILDNSLKHWSTSKFDGTWRRAPPGCRNNPSTFWTNPQFVIRLNEEDDDPDDGETGCSFVDMHTIGFAIYEVRDETNTDQGYCKLVVLCSSILSVSSIVYSGSISFIPPSDSETVNWGLGEFATLWKKIQRYLEIYKKNDVDGSGTMSTPEMRVAFKDAGFSLNNALYQLLVARYAEQDLTLDFDNFTGCLMRLEMMFRIFQKLDSGGSGSIELNMNQV
uniref:Calpain 2, (m/II) large subunit b n=1 Tax=Neogobius melanostomus TaxID=47308 RepID=A0A8C6SGP4_9GOBI